MGFLTFTGKELPMGLKSQKFWMVLGYGTPTFRHPSFDSAKTEAKRLAGDNPGIEFHVLESIGYVVNSNVLWVSADDGEQIPF